MEEWQARDSAGADDACTEAASSTLAATQPWRLMDRSTAAGRRLFNLYFGNNIGKSAGQAYSRANRLAHEQKLAAGWVPKPPASAAPQRPAPRAAPKVAVPRFVPRPPQQLLAPSVDAVPRRRPADVIQAEMREEAGRMLRHKPAPGPMMGEAEKARCALLMQVGGEAGLAELVDLAGRDAGRVDVTPDMRAIGRQLLGRLEAAADEVRQRRAALDRLPEAGTAIERQTAELLRNEIAARIREMQQLDAQLDKLQL